MTDRLYSTYQVADLLGATPDKIVQWMQRGLLPYKRLPDGPVRIAESSLIRFLKDRGVRIEDVLAKAADDTRYAALASENLSAPHRAKEALLEADDANGRTRMHSLVLPADPAASITPEERAALSSLSMIAPHPGREAAAVTGDDVEDDVEDDIEVEDDVEGEDEADVDVAPCVEVEETDEPSEPVEPQTVDEQGEPIESQASNAPGLRPGGDRDRARGSDSQSDAFGGPDSAPDAVEGQYVSMSAAPAAPRDAGRTDGPLTADALLAMAVRRGATHVHLSTADASVHLRVGASREPLRAAADVPALLAQLKVRSGLGDAPPAAPRTAEFSQALAGRPVRLRAALCPLAGGGESLVLHLLEPAAPRGLAGLPLAPADADALLALATEPGGLIVVTGSLRAGGRDVLYALAAEARGPQRLLALDRLDTPRLRGTQQVRCEGAAALSFSDALAAAADQDPDALLTADLPDPASAAAALAAARDGATVLAALNAPSAPESVQRLLDLGLEPWALATALRGVVEVRRVRALCEHCRRPAAPDATLLHRARLSRSEMGQAFAPVGCDVCDGEGYRGELLLVNAIRLTPALSAALRDCGSANAADAGRTCAESAFARLAIPTLRAAALARVREGATSLEEIIRVLPR